MTYKITFETDIGDFIAEVESAGTVLSTIQNLSYLKGNSLTGVSVNPIVLVPVNSIRKVGINVDIEVLKADAEKERVAAYEAACRVKSAHDGANYPTGVALQGSLIGGRGLL